MSRNVAASVHQRLLNIARKDDVRFNEVFQHYTLERWLYRLSVSEHADRFVLKGAMMLVVWQLPVTRPTKDIDLLARTGNDLENIERIIREICTTDVEEDGLVFDERSVVSVRIAEEAMYEGVRATFSGTLGNARAAIRIDLGFSDIITPGAVSLTYPTILEQPAPQLKAYNQETAIAEKFEAIVQLGEINSRMKDFFDIWALSSSQGFDGAVLSAAIAATFANRKTALIETAVCFTEGFGLLEEKQAQWSTFLNRTELTGQAPETFAEIWKVVMAFLKPMMQPESQPICWSPGGPWEPI